MAEEATDFGVALLVPRATLKSVSKRTERYLARQASQAAREGPRTPSAVFADHLKAVQLGTGKRELARLKADQEARDADEEARDAADAAWNAHKGGKAALSVGTGSASGQ